MYFIRIFPVTILILIVAETILAGNNEIEDHPNAHIGCAGYCFNKCSNYQLGTPEKRREFCPHACILGWACNDGYVYDDHIEQCVKPEDCSPEGLKGTN